MCNILLVLPLANFVVQATPPGVECLQVVEYQVYRDLDLGPRRSWIQARSGILVWDQGLGFRSGIQVWDPGPGSWSGIQVRDPGPGPRSGTQV